MPYRYLALSPSGQQESGLLQVETEAAAERALWDRGLTIVNLRPASAGFDPAQWFPTFFGPKRRDVIVFSQQLATLVDSGIAIVPALQLLSEESGHRSLRRVLRRVLEQVRTGASLSSALAEHPLVFPDLYARMVQVGEQTGNIGVILRQLSVYLEKEQTVVRRVRDAMVYPAFLLVMAFGVVLILLNFTLPPLLRLYDEFEATLPWPTRFLMDLTEFVTAYRLPMVVGALLVIVVLLAYVRTPGGRKVRDQALLRIPALGAVSLQGAVARFSRTLATLLQAGLALPESLELTGRTMSNVIVRQSLDDLRREALQGRGLSEPIARMRWFPRLLAQMVRVGEETGTLDRHLTTLADYYEGEVDRSLKALTGFLEPAMIIFVGGVVGFVAISVVMPMYTLLGSIR
jgi:type IV pilus assembly protein PilC